MKVLYDTTGIHLSWEGDDDTPLVRMEKAQAVTLIEALQVYCDKNVKYKDNWRRMGWRGLLARIRERSDRLWDTFWMGVNWKSEGVIDADDAIDLINFAAFFVRQTRDCDEGGWMNARDGEWWRSI